MTGIDMQNGTPAGAASALEALEREVSRSADMLVAFSGGVDSAVLLAAAARALGKRAVAFTADSPSMPRRELDDALHFAATLGVEHHVLPTSELDRAEYVRNASDRCYWCKRTLFEQGAALATQLGMSVIAYGFTTDDQGDWRPGHRAAMELGIRAPLFDAGLGKTEIRAIARLLALEVAEKPAAPCLASRVPYGSNVTPSKLSRIEAMEERLHALGFGICRARYDGSVMRLEVERSEIARLKSFEADLRTLAAELGIGKLEIDHEGFRSGRLNEGIVG